MKIGKHLITFSLITLITVLGFAFTLKGDSAGEIIKRGAELKAKETNDAGGVNGKTCTIISENDINIFQQPISPRSFAIGLTFR